MAKASEQIIDEILVIDAQAGRAQALEALVARWHKRLWQHAFRLVGDSEAAWDVTQQSWLAIIKGLRKLREPAQFKAWAYQITTRKAVDWIRKDQRRKRAAREAVQRRKCELAADAEVRELLEKLDVKKKVVLSLYYFEQLNVSEISMALKIPKGTVRSRLHQAREALRALWQQCIEE
ncbi:MAG: RNA polymerase sigma factor [Phycisphaerales bacterium]|nr:MAG: RNA polymerase sigma factor [Phycisphaerales bacterium]